MTQVSVIVCCYNDGRFLGRALESLCQQTLPADQFELVLVNDGSSDETESVARSFLEKLKSKYLRSHINKGLVESCNLALRHVAGTYVIRLDADDVFDATILEKMSGAAYSNATDFVYSDRLEFLQETGDTRYVSLAEFSVFKLIACGTMLRADRLVEIGGYRSLFWEEYDLYMRYLTSTRKNPVYVSQPLYTYTIRPGSMTADGHRIKQGWKELKELWSDDALAKFGPLPFTGAQDEQ